MNEKGSNEYKIKELENDIRKKIKEIDTIKKDNEKLTLYYSYFKNFELIYEVI